MKVIVVSNLCTTRIINYLIKNSKAKPLQSIQKYMRLLCEGIVEHKISVETITAIPVVPKAIKKRIWFNKKEYEKEIQFNYVPFLNFPLFRKTTLLINSFFMALIKGIKNKNCIFVCDVLNKSISTGTLFASKILRKKCIAIVTDIPSYIDSNMIIHKVLKNLFKCYDGYVFLTSQMNDKLNYKNKKYIVIEGIADKNVKIKKISNKKNNDFTILYAGGLFERYGLRNLVEAFKMIKNPSIRLEIYGAGDLENYLKKIDDNRIKFFGIVENSVIVKREYEVQLLVNPRFSNQEYTLYSFPSKNMEYMASGTPMLTTVLPGIPKEYFNYCYTIKDESIDGMRLALEKIINIDYNERIMVGKNAQKFILDNKNHYVQARKLLNFINL